MNTIQLNGRSIEFAAELNGAEIEMMFDASGSETFDITNVVEVVIEGAPHKLKESDELVFRAVF